MTNEYPVSMSNIIGHKLASYTGDIFVEVIGGVDDGSPQWLGLRSGVS